MVILFESKLSVFKLIKSKNVVFRMIFLSKLFDMFNLVKVLSPVNVFCGIEVNRFELSVNTLRFVYDMNVLALMQLRNVLLTFIEFTKRDV